MEKTIFWFDEKGEKQSKLFTDSNALNDFMNDLHFNHGVNMVYFNEKSMPEQPPTVANKEG